MSLLEVVMLLCFGASWPFSIARILRTRDASGKSPAFLVIIMAGYAAGIGNKLLTSRDWVMLLYAMNLCMVSLDLWLCLSIGKANKKAKRVARAIPGDGQSFSYALEPLDQSEVDARMSGKWPTQSQVEQRRSWSHGKERPQKKRSAR